MLLKEKKTETEIITYLDKVVLRQYGYEKKLNKSDRKKNGVFLTNSLSTIDNILSIVEIDSEIFQKQILEPSCGQGILILKLIADIYNIFPDEKLIVSFIEKNIFFVDIQKEMVDQTSLNIRILYNYLFGTQYGGTLNGIVSDFTLKEIEDYSLFTKIPQNIYRSFYNTFDYVIGNPPYVTLYGRRDKKENENQRVNYLKNYSQFPTSVKNGKINLVMLFIEHSLDCLKDGGSMSFIIDVSFFETAYEFTRKFLLENSKIIELHVNIKDFEVASGQVILKVAKSRDWKSNKVKVIDHKSFESYLVDQVTWFNKSDEYKFRFNNCGISKSIIEKIDSKGDNTLLQLFPSKNLRTCVMLLDMEEMFTSSEFGKENQKLVYPYYQGSKSLAEKFAELKYKKYFFYNKSLQDKINDELKIQLEKEGVKNKKRLGLGETIIYDNPKIYIRQSAKEIIATVDLNKSSANNSLYVFSLRDNSEKTIDFLFFLCGLMNCSLISYYSQQMKIIRYSPGKQPQIKISDLGTIKIPRDKMLQDQISTLCRNIYLNADNKIKSIETINSLIYEYYNLTDLEIENIKISIKDF